MNPDRRRSLRSLSNNYFVLFTNPDEIEAVVEVKPEMLTIGLAGKARLFDT